MQIIFMINLVAFILFVLPKVPNSEMFTMMHGSKSSDLRNMKLNVLLEKMSETE